MCGLRGIAWPQAQIRAGPENVTTAKSCAHFKWAMGLQMKDKTLFAWSTAVCPEKARGSCLEEEGEKAFHWRSPPACGCWVTLVVWSLAVFMKHIKENRRFSL